MPIPKFVQVGSLTLSAPAFVVALTGVVVSVGMTIAAPKLIFASLLVLAAFFVAAYNVNCAIVGNCSVWAWVLAVMYVLMALVNFGHWQAFAKPYQRFGKKMTS